ncbi:MAG: hypothetical protein JWN86_3377 [Planctomycetota bacterium]|nr:hypothetical protein [Planctomycetota bacterium]
MPTIAQSCDGSCNPLLARRWTYPKATPVVARSEFQNSVCPIFFATPLHFRDSLGAGWNPVIIRTVPEDANPKAFSQPLTQGGSLLSVWGYSPREGWSRFDAEERAGDAVTPPSPRTWSKATGRRRR